MQEGREQATIYEINRRSGTEEREEEEEEEE